MTETEFHRAVDAAFARVEAAIERDGTLDADREGGVLTVECPDGSKVILSRQPPLAEIWVAARSGGFHYGLKDGAWRDTRSGAEFFSALAQIFASQGGAKVDYE